MLRISLVLRFCLMLSVSLWLGACTTVKPSVVIKPAGNGIQSTIPSIKTCPVNLFDLNQQQAAGLFLRCDPSKDGTAFDIAYQGVWLLVDTEKQQLEVKSDNETLAVFSNIAIGRSGAGFKNRRGDDVTPLGEYKIGWINPQSPFHIFYGLTYPSIDNAREALSKGLISQSEHDAILYAHQNNQIPPQNTALGGQVGLHGLGKGDEEIHRKMNWTHGCVALTNSQVDELAAWIVEGMRVKIK